MNDQFHGDWEAYVQRINTAAPAVAVLGVTDYFSIRGYKRCREIREAGGMLGVAFLFPNIEFRVSPPTAKHKGVNLHLLVDPSAPDHVERIEAALSRLIFKYDRDSFACDEPGLTRLGKVLDPTQRDQVAAYRKGVEQFKIGFERFREWLLDDHWLRSHSLVALSNNESDGVAGLPQDHGFFAVQEEILRFGHIILSGNPNDRRFWLGLKAATVEDLVLLRHISPALPGYASRSADSKCS